VKDLVKAEHIVKLKESMESAINAGELIQVSSPLEHYFTPTQYARRVYVKKGTTIISAIHKSEHIAVALKGHFVIVDEIGDRHNIEAPAVLVTKPGTQRAIHALVDSEWLTVHTYDNEDRSPEAVWYELVCDTMQEYNNLLEAQK